MLTVKWRMSDPSSWIHTLLGSNKKCQLAFDYKGGTFCYNSNGLNENRDIHVRIYRDRYWSSAGALLFKSCSSLSMTH